MNSVIALNSSRCYRQTVARLVCAAGVIILPLSTSLAQVLDVNKPPAAEKVIRKPDNALEQEAIKKVEPVYPPIAKAARASGDVKIEVVVDEKGKVISARVVSGHPLLRDSALTAARQWIFKPALRDGSPVKITGILTFHFALKDKADSPVAKREPKSDPAEELCEQGQELSRAGRYDEAIGKYREALRIKPDYAWAHYYLGMAYLDIKRSSEAETSCARALKIRGEELRRDGDGEQDLLYENSMICLGLAGAYLRKYDEAIKHFRKVSELEKEMADVRVFLGTVLKAKGDHEAAIAAFKESVAIKRTPTPYFLLAEIYLEQNHWKEAIDSYKQCLELEDGPYVPQSHYGLGIAFLRLGDKRSAMNEYRVLKKINNPDLAEQLLREINK